jgi:release factor glutamine methyltransferase
MTVGAALETAAARIAAAGIGNARREARLLLALALGIEANAFVSSETPIAPADAARFAVLVARRAGREPYSRIAGRREFWSLQFLLSPDTLDPRPDSETVIEAALARIPDRAAPLHIVDFGTGTGALLLALLSELPNAQGVGVDRAAGAVETARRNAAALGLGARARFVRGNWGESLVLEADVILANPPYIPFADLTGLAPEIGKFDPRLALDGGPDGLRAYREIAADMRKLLAPAGFTVCEIGQGQGVEIARIMSRVGLEMVAKHCDLAGIDRCLVFERRKNIGKSQNKSLMK